MPGTSLLEHFSALQDPRQAGKVGYRLPEVLLVVLCGTMAGAENFVEIERWANKKLAFLRRLLPFRRGIPSHDTLNDVMKRTPGNPVRGLLHGLGRDLAGGRARHRGHRRKDLSAGEARRHPSAPSRVRLGLPATARPRPGGG